MNDIIIFIGMWIGIALFSLLIHKFDKSDTNKNINV
jgi:hypothetical protein